MAFTIKVKGDLKKIIPALNKSLEAERKKLLKEKVFFTIERVISDQ